MPTTDELLDAVSLVVNYCVRRERCVAYDDIAKCPLKEWCNVCGIMFMPHDFIPGDLPDPRAEV